ncbi:MAG: glycosyltransferase family 2 protein [Acidobacteriota bacterium]|nr:glycosyltransferase family 2 protein [Acidobacteriota bacterium]
MNDARRSEKEFLSVVMPLYREGSHLRTVLAAVRDALATVNVRYEFVLVDDGSSDDTWAVITEEAKTCQMLRAARLSRNFGKESALCAGLELARGDAVVVMDGDGQHLPSLLPEMVRIWRETGADIVEATKVTRGPESPFDKLSAGLFYLIWNKLSGFELRGASDFKLMNRRTVNAWLQMEERNVFFRGMTAWLGFIRVQIPFEVQGRVGGQTEWSFLRRLKLALTGISAFSSLPLQLITFAGLFFMLFALVFGAQTLFVILTGRAVSGFATVIFLLLIIGSLLMISLGIIGEYLARIYDEVKRRPRYVIGQSIEPGDLSSNISRVFADATVVSDSSR